MLSPLAAKVEPFCFSQLHHMLTSVVVERIDKAAEVLAPVFRNDPVITYMLCSLEDDAARVAYLPAYFHTLFKQAALNQASFSEIAEWKCCTVMLPPGKSVGNLWTSIPAGFFSTLVKLGLSGINVSKCATLSSILTLCIPGSQLRHALIDVSSVCCLNSSQK